METITKLKAGYPFFWGGGGCFCCEDGLKILLTVYKLERVSQGNSCKCRQHSMTLEDRAHLAVIFILTIQMADLHPSPGTQAAGGQRPPT